MNLAFLTPLFLVGMGLIAAPYFIHRIRRPEREPLRFSSLLFLPDVKKEVIERRRVQHILLMLMRMAMLLLLAFAFARPYLSTIDATESETGPKRHLILLDTSYSMAGTNLFEEAQSLALEALEAVAEGEPVTLMTFGSHAQAHEAKMPQDARALILAAEPTYEATDYVTALQAAQAVLMRDHSDEQDDQLHLYLVSDFQRGGMPEHSSEWKLASSIQLHTLPVTTTEDANFAISDIHVRLDSNNEIRIFAKVKNWSEEDVDALDIRLVVHEEPVAQLERSIKAGHATQVSFTVPQTEDAEINGYVELGDDALNVDNRRYFTWSAPRSYTVAVIAEDAPDLRGNGNAKWPASWFFMQAFADDSDAPFKLHYVEEADVAARVDSATDKPDALIVADSAGLQPATLEAITRYAKQGGPVLIGLTQIDTSAQLTTDLDVESTASRKPSSSDFDMMTWIDFDHPIFLPFRGQRFNDFSAIRFFGHTVLQVGDTPKELARFEDGTPAMLECELGEGTVILWPFALQLDWTNLPKTSRFVPILFETLAYLCDINEDTTTWFVGDRLSPETSPLPKPGIIAGPEYPVAVNIQADEGDPMTIDPAELELKLTSAPTLFSRQNGQLPEGDSQREGNVLNREFGYLLLLILFPLLLLESWYMTRMKE